MSPHKEVDGEQVNAIGVIATVVFVVAWLGNWDAGWPEAISDCVF
jgi:hypothetical protein